MTNLSICQKSPASAGRVCEPSEKMKTSTSEFTCSFFILLLAREKMLKLLSLIFVGIISFHFKQGAAGEHCSQRPTKTLQCSCENVPAIFQFFVNGNRLSQEPACRFQTIFKPNLMSGRERFASSKDVEIQTSRFFSDLVFILFLSGLMECFCT